jgi:hypothetical protein
MPLVAKFKQDMTHGALEAILECDAGSLELRSGNATHKSIRIASVEARHQERHISATKQVRRESPVRILAHFRRLTEQKLRPFANLLV